MLRLFVVLLVFLPLTELYVLIEVGSRIGGATTILLCLFTAALGGWLVRTQGLHTLFTARRHMMAGEIPALPIAHGILLSLAGLLLLTPGFVTDIIGFLLLVPGLRNFIIRRWFPASFIATTQKTWIEGEVVERTSKNRHSLH